MTDNRPSVFTTTGGQRPGSVIVGMSRGELTILAWSCHDVARLHQQEGRITLAHTHFTMAMEFFTMAGEMEIVRNIEVTLSTPDWS